MDTDTQQATFKCGFGTHNQTRKDSSFSVFICPFCFSHLILKSLSSFLHLLKLIKYVDHSMGLFVCRLFEEEITWDSKERQGVKESPRCPWPFLLTGSILLETHPKVGSTFCVMYQQVFLLVSWVCADPQTTLSPSIYHVPNSPTLHFCLSL